MTSFVLKASVLAALATGMVGCGGGSGGNEDPVVIDTFAGCMSELAQLPDTVTATPVSLAASDPVARADLYDYQSTWYDGAFWRGNKDQGASLTEYPAQAGQWLDEHGAIAAQVVASDFNIPNRMSYLSASFDSLFSGQGTPDSVSLKVEEFYSSTGMYLGYLETGSNYTWGFGYGTDLQGMNAARRDALEKDVPFHVAPHKRYARGSASGARQGQATGLVEYDVTYLGKGTVQTGLSGELTACKMANTGQLTWLDEQGNPMGNVTQITEEYWVLPTLGVVHRVAREVEVSGQGYIVASYDQKRDLDYRVVNGIKYQMPRAYH
ncbi:hypothetical protein [Chitiniphilus eburneus]|uniref:Lipoprotein n=1 Tax=Chitiniphilus eburneus TaxID=2571148 RepID=A0A4U0QRU8_9NEIS|nr:hypothetical protein [Chitiniphilus eburneus]TJZ78964.1 hypothetical protein FAZ21_01370 [Chitiniphilus eburneus]